MSLEHDHLLDPAGLVDVEHRPIEDVRAQRAACVEVETGLSYLRRLVQGSIDIVGQASGPAEPGVDHPGTGDLVERLADILGDASARPTGTGRLVEALEPTRYDTELAAEYERLVGDGRVAAAADLDPVERAALLDELRSLERRISDERQRYHVRIDALQAELTRRYRTGEASVDALLRDA